MSEEKKYSIVGKVEIGTDEYRELIESRMEFERKYDRANSDYWSEQSKISKLEKELATTKANSEKYLEFINSSEEMKTKYKLFLAEKQIREQEEGDED